MPYSAFGHCAVKVGPSQMFLAGGNVGRSYVSIAYILNVADNTRIRLQDMKWERAHHSCGLVNGVDVVVAGGNHVSHSRDVEIFSLKTGDWRSGSPLTSRSLLMATVQLGKTFLLVGGTAVGRRILEFDEVDYTWTKREEKLKVARKTFAAVLVPCS